MEKAAGFLPEKLSAGLLFLSDDLKQRTEEIRIRCGRPVILTLNDGYHCLAKTAEQSDIDETMQRAARFSYHSIQENLTNGFFTAQGGYRIGVCGTAITEQGILKGLKNYSSLCIRIPHPADCVSDTILKSTFGKNVLICSPPGVGKTTFLRELIRKLSESGQRISMVDERGELAAMQDGKPQFDIGCHTDVLDLCPKHIAAEMLLRSMSPQILALDELAPEDGTVLARIFAAGVHIIATIHGESAIELQERGVSLRMFQTLIHIRNEHGVRYYEQEALR